MTLMRATAMPSAMAAAAAAYANAQSMNADAACSTAAEPSSESSNADCVRTSVAGSNSGLLQPLQLHSLSAASSLDKQPRQLQSWTVPTYTRSRRCQKFYGQIDEWLTSQPR